MPIYEYQCRACEHTFETTQRITESPLKDCPVCHKPELERLISSTAFLLKGGGWYKDGYGKPAKVRTENQVHDRLQKALDDDKKKTAAEATAAAASTAGESTDGSGGGSSSSASTAPTASTTTAGSSGGSGST
jgi:putative FmdB family regulatory protein